jgi:hypothetical protein
VNSFKTGDAEGMGSLLRGKRGGSLAGAGPTTTRGPSGRDEIAPRAPGFFFRFSSFSISQLEDQEQPLAQPSSCLSNPFGDSGLFPTLTYLYCQISHLLLSTSSSVTRKWGWPQCSPLGVSSESSPARMSKATGEKPGNGGCTMHCHPFGRPGLLFHLCSGAWQNQTGKKT